SPLAPAGDELQRMADRANRLLAVTTALSNAATVFEVAQVTLSVGLSVVEAARGLFATREPDGVNLIHTEGFSLAEQQKVLGLHTHNIGPLDHCVLTGVPIYIRTAEEYALQYPEAYERVGAVSDSQAYAAVPLLHDGKVIGGIGFTFAHPTAFGA